MMRLIIELRRSTRIGLEKVLRKAFPKDWDKVLSLSWFLACEGNALAHADAWCRNHEVPAKQRLSSQRISELLSSIDEDSQQTFFKLWGKVVSENDYLCYDITSVSSYSELNEYVCHGYNRDGEKLPQINLAMLLGQTSQLPVAYRVLPGSIPDVRTLKCLLAGFDKLEYPKLRLVMDKGFYSNVNVNDLLTQRYNFILGVPSHLKWVREKIDLFRDKMYGPQGYKKVDDEIIYTHTHMDYWEPAHRRYYLHLYFNAHAAAEQYDDFTETLLHYKEELESGERIPEHESYYEQFFHVKATPKRGIKVSYNHEVIEAYRNRYAGFFALISTKEKEAVKALQLYRDKDVIEKSFDDLKNSLDMKRLRVHSSSRMKGRLFLQFIALIYSSQIRKGIRESELNGKYSPKELMHEMESLTQIRYSGKYKSIITEETKNQRQILESFGSELPT
jgi:transposase